MKNLNKVVMGLAALVLLTGCSSQKKVSYEEFHKQAVEAYAKVKDAGYTKVTVNGTVKVQGAEMKLDKVELTVKDGVITTVPTTTEQMMAASVFSMNAATIPEDKETTYYVGGGFKVSTKTDEQTGEAKFDKYGLMTSYKVTYGEEKMDLTAKWSK